MRIIHLSDFHFEYDYIKHADYIALNLIRALVAINQELSIDLIICSGDILHKYGSSFGNAKIGYSHFRQHIITPICEQLKLHESYFLIVPGNHDLNIVEGHHIIQKQFTDIDSIHKLSVFLSKESTLKFFTNRTSHFLEFQRTLLSLNDNITFKQNVFQTNVCFKVKDGIVGISLLNTTFGCFNSIDSDNHIVLNINNIIESTSFFKDCFLKLIIGHHNYNAVRRFELNQVKYITANYDAYFCGHTHGRSEYNVHKQDNCFIFRAPSMLTNTKCFCSSKHINGFLVIDLYRNPLTSEISMYYQDNNGEFYMQRHMVYT